jgi:hypothetical protein
MPNRSRKRKPRDLNQLAQAVVDEATGNAPPEPEAKPEDDGKNPAAVALGRLGGLKGGKARWEGTTKAQRSEAGRRAARARWKRKNAKKTD